MTTTDTLIVGGGQAGLALSRCLTSLGRDHLVLERGRIAERWRSERWASLRLLTPNWMTRLPGWAYDGEDPDGFMAAPEVASFFDRYAASFDAPVLQESVVQRVSTRGDGFAVATDDREHRARNVVIATGWCDRPAVPAWAGRLSGRIHQLHPSSYQSPADLPHGGVLVVGASATGLQLADELQSSGREVTLAVGNHRRAPRRYRGMDIFWWLELIGSFEKTIDDVDDIIAARTEPSLGVVGRPDHSTLDLATLAANGVRIVGRALDGDGTRLSLGTDVRRLVDTADRQMAGLLGRIDQAIEQFGLTAEVLDPEPIPSLTMRSIPDSIDLAAVGIETIVWATGYRRGYEWLDLPLLDHRGEIAQHRGVTCIPGAYVLGQRFQHFRNSNFIDGVGRDATFVAEHICRRDSVDRCRASVTFEQK